ncbi:hypothetical protein LWI28_003896 [Acer negundo]|uniref:Uncharacterized protein n=1 Tax=Acer negundo TaxID=4023 RepID=A0AAD5NTP1_ACENE|nr:hypothetical protein LWI28_003896 [Acer negundo]
MSHSVVHLTLDEQSIHKDSYPCLIVTHRWWFASNLILESKCPWGGWNEVKYVVAWSNEFLADYKATNKAADEQTGVVLPNQIKWEAQREGIYKLDVHLFRVGYGLVIQDHMGSVMDTIAQCVMLNFPPQVVGAMAILQGMEFARSIPRISPRDLPYGSPPGYGSIPV